MIDVNHCIGGRMSSSGQSAGEHVQDSNHCLRCGVPLVWDDKGIYMKMVTRNAREFLCMDCLAKNLGCTRKDLEERVRYFRESGNCTLFR